MNRIPLVRVCDLLVLAVLVAVAASFHWMAALAAAALGLWIGFMSKPHRDQAKVRRHDRAWVWDPLDPINRHWHW
jgi:hypothetical protein